MIIKQGDAYAVPIYIELDGQTITDSTLYAVETVEVCLETTRKEYRKDGEGDITFADGAFLFPLTQEETLALTEGPGFFDIRVKTTDGNVKGTPFRIPVTIADAVSREVL